MHNEVYDFVKKCTNYCGVDVASVTFALFNYIAFPPKRPNVCCGAEFGNFLSDAADVPLYNGSLLPCLASKGGV